MAAAAGRGEKAGFLMHQKVEKKSQISLKGRLARELL